MEVTSRKVLRSIDEVSYSSDHSKKEYPLTKEITHISNPKEPKEKEKEEKHIVVQRRYNKKNNTGEGNKNFEKKDQNNQAPKATSYYKNKKYKPFEYKESYQPKRYPAKQQHKQKVVYIKKEAKAKEPHDEQENPKNLSVVLSAAKPIKIEAPIITSGKLNVEEKIELNIKAKPFMPPTQAPQHAQLNIGAKEFVPQSQSPQYEVQPVYQYGYNSSNIMPMVYPTTQQIILTDNNRTYIANITAIAPFNL